MNHYPRLLNNNGASLLRRLQFLILIGMLGCTASCALPREITKTPRSAIEQLLLGEAVDRSLRDIAIPVPLESPLFMEVTGLQPAMFAPLGLPSSSGPNTPSVRSEVITPSLDLIFVKDLVAARLGSLGYRLLKNEEEAVYLVRVVVQSFGTSQSSSFFGLPPVQSVIIPFSLPQLTLYQSLYQNGFIRYSLHVIERATGRLYHSTPWYHHATFHDQYTILFFMTFRRTDLTDPP
jgi:hypothetical protein